MYLEFIIPVLTAVAGVFGIITGIRKTKSTSSLSQLKIEIDDSRPELEKVLSKEEIESFVSKIESVEVQQKAQQKVQVASHKQGGGATKNFLVYIVPGVVALALVGLYIYLHATNAGNSAYKTPEDLSSLMTVVIGYLFGAGAASV
jgi:hypothetical protein